MTRPRLLVRRALDFAEQLLWLARAWVDPGSLPHLVLESTTLSRSEPDEVLYAFRVQLPGESSGKVRTLHYVRSWED